MNVGEVETRHMMIYYEAHMYALFTVTISEFFHFTLLLEKLEVTEMTKLFN